jgi:hypothetical protein
MTRDSPCHALSGPVGVPTADLRQRAMVPPGSGSVTSAGISRHRRRGAKLNPGRTHTEFSTSGHLLMASAGPAKAHPLSGESLASRHLRGSDPVVVKFFSVEQLRDPPTTSGDRPETDQFRHQVLVVVSADNRQAGRP